MSTTQQARTASIGQMAASIAHEVQQPLAVIALNAQVALRCLERDQPPSQAHAALRAVLEASARASAMVHRACNPSDQQCIGGSLLSKRELEILAHLSSGKSNKVIARAAGIAVGTVKYHVNNILLKLDVSCRTEAASVALRRGLVHPY